MNKGNRIPCKAIEYFRKIWELGERRRAARNAQLSLEESEGITSLVLRGELLKVIANYFAVLSRSLDREIRRLRDEESRQLMAFERLFEIYYYELECPQKCIEELLNLERRLRWVSTVFKAYNQAKLTIQTIRGGSKLLRALQIHIESMEKKYSEELSDLRYLCPRLLELCGDIFYHFNVIPNVRVSCVG